MKYLAIVIFGLFISCEAFPSNGVEFVHRCSNVNEKSENNSTLVDAMQAVDLDAVKHLKLSGCDLDVVLDAIKEFKHLIALDISGSNYESLNSLHLKHEHLMRFNASHNSLFEIPKGFFNETPQISEIDLSFNKLERIESTTFKGAADLSRIHLDNNELSYIERGAFVNLTKLELLDLSSNMLSGVDQIFQNNDNLAELHFENNPIGPLDCNILSLLSRTVSVDVSLKNIETLNLNCIKGRVTLRPGNQEKITSTNGAVQLHFNGESFKNLRFFTAGSNLIENIPEILSALGPSIEYLDLSGNSLGQLSVGTFQKFTNLRRLNLSDTKLHDFDFEAVKTSNKLIELDISNNNLKIVKNPTALESKRLTYFNANGNQIENISEIIQHLSSTIEFLDVSGNSVGTLNATTFDKLKSLRRLYLSNTSLSIVDVNPFDQLTKLHTLEINYNNLKHLNFSMLSSTLEKLVWFEAADCQIQNTHDVLKLLPSSILKIDLSGNFVGEVNSSTFSKFPKLIYLILSRSNLSNFDFATIEHHDNLEMLDISHNQLTRLETTINLEHLKSLNLEGNDLLEVRFTRAQFPHLTSMLISENQFTCEFLVQFHRVWSDIKFDDDSWTQKHGHECKRSEF